MSLSRRFESLFFFFFFASAKTLRRFGLSPRRIAFPNILQLIRPERRYRMMRGVSANEVVVSGARVGEVR